MLDLLRLAPRPAAALVAVKAAGVLIPTGLALATGWLLSRIEDIVADDPQSETANLW